jgi:hypothetical protein
MKTFPQSGFAVVRMFWWSSGNWIRKCGDSSIFSSDGPFWFKSFASKVDDHLWTHSEEFYRENHIIRNLENITLDSQIKMIFEAKLSSFIQFISYKPRIGSLSWIVISPVAPTNFNFLAKLNWAWQKKQSFFGAPSAGSCGQESVQLIGCHAASCFAWLWIFDLTFVYSTSLSMCSWSWSQRSVLGHHLFM